MFQTPSRGRTRLPFRLGAGAAILALLAAGCGSSSSTPTTATGSGATTSTGSSPAPTAQGRTTTTPGKVGEVSPSGDIPDNQAYVRYPVPGQGVSVKVPEGWSRVTSPSFVLFTDKLNSIRVELGKPTSAAAMVNRLAQMAPGFQKGTVSSIQRPAGKATKITYLAQSAPDPVTGKRVTDAVERYLFDHNGRELVLTLSGPKGADNVDPWRIVTTSVQFSR